MNARQISPRTVQGYLGWTIQLFRYRGKKRSWEIRQAEISAFHAEQADV